MVRDFINYNNTPKIKKGKTFTNQQREPLLLHNKRVLYPDELQKLIDVIPKRKHSLIVQCLYLTGLRYETLKRFRDNPEWFKDGYIALPKGSMLKQKARQKERIILLSIKGKEIVKEFLKVKPVIPVRQSMNVNLSRWMEEAGLNPKGIGCSSFRKMYVSYLVATKEHMYLRILSSTGHTQAVSLTSYIALPFTSKDKALINTYFYGWGEE